MTRRVVGHAIVNWNRWRAKSNSGQNLADISDPCTELLCPSGELLVFSKQRPIFLHRGAATGGVDDHQTIASRKSLDVPPRKQFCGGKLARVSMQCSATASAALVNQLASGRRKHAFCSTIGLAKQAFHHTALENRDARHRWID